MRENPPSVTQGHPVPMLFGRYRLVSTLSRGPRGTVYEAFDPDTRRRVALRVLPLAPASASRGLLLRWRTKQRDRAAAKLSHANIVALLAHGQAGEFRFIATEFVEGLPLPAYLERVGTLPALQGLALTVQLLSALGFAHGRGQVHGAIQPENLMVTRTGQLKVAGFGWAAGDPGAPVPGRFHVPLYLAPEQQRGAPADAQADLYSAALVARLLLGGGPPSDPAASLPPKVAAVFARALAVQPQDRLRDADALCSALQGAVGAPVWDRAALTAPPASTDEAANGPARGVAQRPSEPAQILTTRQEPFSRQSPVIQVKTSKAVKSEPVAWTAAEAAEFTRFTAPTPELVEPRPAAAVPVASRDPAPAPASKPATASVGAVRSVAQPTPAAPAPERLQQNHKSAREAERLAPIAPHTAPVHAPVAPKAAHPHRRHRRRGLALAAAAAAAFVLVLGAVLLQREPAPESMAAANVEPSSPPVATRPTPDVQGAAAPAATSPAAAVMGAAPAVDVAAPVVRAPASPLPATTRAQSPAAPVAPPQPMAATTRPSPTLSERQEVQRVPPRQATPKPQEARVAPARQATARTDPDRQRTGDTAREPREPNRQVTTRIDPDRQRTSNAAREPREPARQATARVDPDRQRAGDAAREPREPTTPTEARRPSRPQVAQAYDLHIGCRQDATLTREVCKAIKCASSEFQRHPVCVRRIAEQRTRDAERELYSGGR